ncbi:MAG TPA: hypothetical protein VIF57_03570 [Polyangia bacterium]|jgi:hypothetical protein
MGDADSARLTRQTVAAAVALIAVVAIAGGLLWWRRPRLEPIEVSQQTTYVIQPTRADGWVDYPGAVDWMRRAGLDAGGANAAPALARALPALPESLQGESVDPGAAPSEALPSETRAWLAERCPAFAGKQPTLASVRRWIARAEPALASLREASGAKALYVPIPRAGGARGFGQVGARSDEAARALRCRAAVRQLEGEPAAGWADVEALWKLGALLARSATPAEYASGANFWKGAMEATVDLAADDRAGAELLAAMQAGLRALPSFPPATESLSILRLETLHRAATALVTGAPGSGPLAPPGTGARLVELNRQFDALEAALQIAEPKQRLARVDQAAAGATAGEEAARRLLTDEIRARSYQQLAAIALALAKHNRETGKPAASLAELGALPSDPGSGQAFAYAPDARRLRLFGVGGDGRADGGDPQHDVVALGVAPARLPAP